MTLRLSTLYSDSTSRLGRFLDEIWQSFELAGLQVPLEAAPEHIVIVDSMHASNRPKTIVRDRKQPSKLRQALPPLFETENITRKFENFVFAENIRLERLSLCKLGLLGEISRLGAEAQLQEICSVLLP